MLRSSLLFSIFIISTILLGGCHPNRGDRDPSAPSAIGIMNVTFMNTDSDTPLVQQFMAVEAIFSDTGQEELLPIVTDNTGSFRGSIAKKTETFITGFIFTFEIRGYLHIIEVQTDLALKFDQPYPEVTLLIDVDPDNPTNNN